MNQKRLYHTIESFASDQFRNEKDLLKHVVREIIRNEQIHIKGGRIWELEPARETYKLIYQSGEIERLEQKYRIPINGYPIFLRIGEQRSVVAQETDKYLRKKGILRYSATGVGERLSIRKKPVYQYVLAFNADSLDQQLLPELNVISVAISSLLSRKRMERRATLLEKDIDKAREIQLSILPEPEHRFYNYDLYGISVPDRIVGGDFFDYLYADEDKDRLCVFVGDAASKGLKAAAQAMYVVGAVRMGISYRMKISSMMSRVNDLLHRTFSEDQFVSFFYAEFPDDKKGLLLYSNAGHNSPLIYHAHENRIELLQPTGQILGPFPTEKFRVENTYMHPGDVAVLYTDGISEARKGEEWYGEQRLAKKLVELHTGSARDICEGILKDVDEYSKGSEEGDDKTLIVVKRFQ